MNGFGDTSATSLREVTGRSVCSSFCRFLPQGTNRWYYSEWSELAWLASRDAYREKLLDSRLEALAALIDEHGPAAVVAYSRNYRDHWSTLAEGRLKEVGLRSHEAKVEVGRRGETRIYVCHHPTSFLKKRNEYFAELGELVGAVGASSS